ncbi:MAG TPA: hypothetical protein ENI82_04485, partial [Bacteroidetes bacterium]|nr:hypothetical protein [Bacteroidota bacterium]
MKYLILLTVALFISTNFYAQEVAIPQSYSNIEYHNGKLRFYDKSNNTWIDEVTKVPKYTYSKIVKDPIGTETGIRFDFQDTTINGTIYYGLIKTENIEFPQPVFFKRNAKINKGKAKINIIKRLSGKYDFVDWENTGKLILGYRIVDEAGLMIYDGRINLRGKGP